MMLVTLEISLRELRGSTGSMDLFPNDEPCGIDDGSCVILVEGTNDRGNGMTFWAGSYWAGLSR